MNGIVKAYDPQKFVGQIESDGQSYIIRRDSFRRGTQLAEGMSVSFTFSNLSAGATAHNVQPITQKSQQ